MSFKDIILERIAKSTASKPQANAPNRDAGQQELGPSALMMPILRVQ